MSVKIYELNRGDVFTLVDTPEQGELVYLKMDGMYAQVKQLVGYNPHKMYDGLIVCSCEVERLGHITDAEYFEKAQQPSEEDLNDMAKRAGE